MHFTCISKMVENISVIVVNGTGVAFNFGYTIIFFALLRQPTRPDLGGHLHRHCHHCRDRCHGSLRPNQHYGMEGIRGHRRSGAVTGSFMYVFGTIVSVVSS